MTGNFRGNVLKKHLKQIFKPALHPLYDMIEMIGFKELAKFVLLCNNNDIVSGVELITVELLYPSKGELFPPYYASPIKGFLTFRGEI